MHDVSSHVAADWSWHIFRLNVGGQCSVGLFAIFRKFAPARGIKATDANEWILAD